MENITETKEERFRFRYRIGRRILALGLAGTMLGGMVLMWQVQIRDLEMQYVGTVLEEAQQVTNRNTAYLSQPALERAWRLLKATVTKPDTYEEYDTYASLAIAKGDYAGAQPYMQGCIDTSSGENSRELAVLWLRLGSLHTLCEEQEPAIACYNKALELQPDLADAFLLRAQMESELGKLEAAAADLLAYQKLAGSDPVIQAALGGLYESAGSYAEARDCYLLAIESGRYELNTLASCGRCRILCGESAAARNDLERFFQEGGKDTNGDIYAMLGMCQMEAGDFANAVKAFHSAIKLGYADTYLLYSQCVASAFAAGDYETVIADGKAALQDSTNAPDQEIAEINQWIGYAYFSLEDFENAADAFGAALEKDPKMAFLRYYAGVCCMSCGRLEDAVEYFDGSAESGEHASICLYNSALCCIQLGRNEAALERLQAAIDANDNDKAVADAKALLDSFDSLIKMTEG